MSSKVLLTEDSVLSGIVCSKCNKTLPPMTVKQHLEGDFEKECPHNKKSKKAKATANKIDLKKTDLETLSNQE